jgi:hypothetical protein
MPDVFQTAKPKIIQWLAPPISILAGIIATWLTTHLHFLATFHIDQDGVTGTLTQFGIFAVSTLVTYLAHANWVKGHQVELAATIANYTAAGALVPTAGAGAGGGAKVSGITDRAPR